MRRFFQSRAGVAGLAILTLLTVAGIFGPLIGPYPDADTHWHDIGYWQDSPAAVPPVWTRGPWNSSSVSGSGRLEATQVEEQQSEGGTTLLVWRFDLGKTGTPNGTPTKLDAPSAHDDPGVRDAPATHNAPTSYDVPTTRDTPASRDAVLILPGEGKLPVLVSSRGTNGTERELARRLLDVSAGEPARLAFPGLDASELTVTEYLLPGAPGSPAPSLILIGQVSGLLGTDVSKRDIFTGIVLGIRWALLLGVVVSFLTVMTGIILAIGAACYGGWVDLVLNRIYEFFSLMPILPFLIVLSAVFKPSLWTFALLALLFFWTKAFKPVYAMALQIREEGYIEAGRSMGTGRWYRAFRYVLPALLPYGFAIMALSVPGIILYEAGISILGLGDSSVVTWGQMLHDALVQGAVINRLWWWILPPGLMISITGIAFALIGRGMDRVWNPKAPGRSIGAGPSRSRP